VSGPEPRFSLWNLSRKDAAGVEVDAGPESRIRAAAEARNLTARAVSMTDTVFLALPAGQRPSMLDVPSPAAPRPAAPPRQLHVIEQEAAGLAAASSAPRRPGRGHQARDLVDEAYQLGKTDAAAEHRKALGKAWSAWLDLMMSVHPPEAGKSLLQDVLDLEPGLQERFRAVFLNGGKDA
jgi:hypothetical protein